MPSWRCADGSACPRLDRSLTWPLGLPRRGFPISRDLRRVEFYQLDFVMPGSSPRCAIVRKQMRHRPNLRYTARGRPQRVHRVYARTSNLGLRFALTISAVLAID